MALIEHYAAIKQAHVVLVSISVALFVARGIAVLAGAGWPMRAAVRRTSVAIDTLLIGAGGTLWWLLSLHPLRERWLLAKLLLIALYIVLGSFALRRAPTPATRALAFAASIAAVSAVAAIALTRGALDMLPALLR
jgi:uncharacterized membrane protein SirB2